MNDYSAGHRLASASAEPRGPRMCGAMWASIPLFQYSIISFFRLGSPFSASAEPRVPKVFGAVLPNIPVFHLFHYSTPARLNCGKRLEPFGLVWYI